MIITSTFILPPLSCLFLFYWIAIIALFDAIVFDCVRTVFNLDFFNQLKFYKDGSIKYSEIAKYENFESFKIATIEYM